MIKALCTLLLLAAFVPFPAQAKDYTLAPGDKVQIAVAGDPEYSSEAQVRPDGKLTVRNIGDVLAGGMTTTQLQNEITNKLKEYIRNPSVSVSLAGSQHSRVYVMGGGIKPTVVDASRSGTLLSLLTGLGDISGADLRSASLMRDGQEIKKDFYDLFRGGDVSQDIPLMAGDTIILPPTASSRGVYVVGAVNMPKLVVYREGMTLLEAILEAGGFSKFASPNDTKVVRRTEDGQDEIINVKAKQLIRKGELKHNMVLRGGDLIIVEESIF